MTSAEDFAERYSSELWAEDGIELEQYEAFEEAIEQLNRRQIDPRLRFFMEVEVGDEGGFDVTINGNLELSELFWTTVESILLGSQK